jgi:hypothetical protein
VFLDTLLDQSDAKGPMAVPVLEAIDSLYSLSATRNCEIRFSWVVLCLRAGALRVGLMGHGEGVWALGLWGSWGCLMERWCTVGLISCTAVPWPWLGLWP